MDYVRGIIKAVIPRKRKDIIAVAILSLAFTYIGYKTLLQSPPNVNVYTETQYPKEVIRGSYFYLNFDLAWDRSCDVYARRYVVGSDGIEYLALEDSKSVVKGERTRYTARIPVDLNIPLGHALVRSDFTYGCDWWSRYVQPIKSVGRTRSIEVLSEVGEKALNSSQVSSCELPNMPGYSIIRTHYRRRGTTFVAQNGADPS